MHRRTLALPILTRPLLALLMVYLASCGDASVSFCSGARDFCADPPFNTAPEADAGPDQTVASGDHVTLDGRGSRSNGNDIRSHSWAQTSGTSVALTGAGTVQAGFVAPDVDDPTTLVFRLTVVNDSGEADSDSVAVTVESLATAALGAASELLAQHLRPPVLDTPSGCLVQGVAEAQRSPRAAAVAFTGLWLDVRARTAADDTVATSEFLDEARRVVPWLAAEVKAHDGDVVHAFVAAGTVQLLRFTERRDPALHDAVVALAKTVAHAPDEPPRLVARGTHSLMVQGDGVALRRRSAPTDAAARAVRSASAACRARPDAPLPIDRLHLISLVSEMVR